MLNKNYTMINDNDNKKNDNLKYLFLEAGYPEYLSIQPRVHRLQTSTVCKVVGGVGEIGRGHKCPPNAYLKGYLFKP